VVRGLPELFDRRVKARSLAYLFTAGAALGLTTLAFPHPEQVRELQLYVLAGIAFGIAAVFHARADRIADWQIQATLAVGTLILTFANYYVGPTALYPIIYSWVALYAFYFFALRTALLHVAFIAVAYFVLLLIQDPASPVTRWLLAVGTPLVAGLLISRLLDTLREEAASGVERSEAVVRSEERTRLILESAPDAFMAIDGDGKVIRWNRAAEQMFGWPASDAIGQRLRDLVFAEDERPAHDERRRMLVESPDPVTVLRVETALRRRDGSFFPAEETISRVRMGSDVVISAFVRDVSERQRRQKERDQLLREQAARAEAERVATMVGGMQVLLDATLQHATLDAILPDLVVRVRDVLEAEAATIFFVDEEGSRLQVAGSSVGSGGEEGSGSLEFGEGFAGRIAAERRPALRNEPSAEDLVDPALRQAGLVSLIGAPLLTSTGRLTGVIQVGTSERSFSEEDLGLLRLAAERVGLAIEHARVYEREHRIAETLQRSLLPQQLPQPAGMAVAASYLPAAAEAEVGGDWYDVIPVPGGRLGLVMGDVAGKGLAAASMVGQLRSALRAYALEGHDAATVVERLNRVVWTELGKSQMATLIYTVVDPAESTMTWVNAGHMPPLLVPEGERLPHFLEGERSVPLGVLPFPAFEENSLRMEPGGTVVLYTDGLIERPGVHIDDGLALLAEVVKDAPSDPEELCDHVLRTLVPAAGPPDDVALLVLQNTPIADRFTVELATEPEALASMRSLLRRWLRYAEGTDQEIAEITTACGEAATNAIEHAGSRGDTPFEVGGELQGREVAITVRDFGSWRPPREGDQGRGLSLMRALMDSVEVSPSHDGTVVELRRRLNGQADRNGS
jgi:PAS domain S-box-containing protein